MRRGEEFVAVGEGVVGCAPPGELWSWGVVSGVLDGDGDEGDGEGVGKEMDEEVGRKGCEGWMRRSGRWAYLMESAYHALVRPLRTLIAVW